MPYIKVFLNDEKLSVGGGENIDLLLLTIIASKTEHLAQLSLSGKRNVAGNRSEFIEWIRQGVNSNDRVKVILLETASPNLPIAQSTAQVKSIEEIATGRPSEIAIDSIGNSITSAARPSFEIRMSNSIHLRADIENEDTLQFLIAWHRENSLCRFDVDSLSVMENGYTKGRHWIDGNLGVEDWVEVQIIDANERLA